MPTIIQCLSRMADRPSLPVRNESVFGTGEIAAVAENTFLLCALGSTIIRGVPLAACRLEDMVLVFGREFVRRAALTPATLFVAFLKAAGPLVLGSRPTWGTSALEPIGHQGDSFPMPRIPSPRHGDELRSELCESQLHTIRPGYIADAVQNVRR
jgi:hypothetical protein